MKILKPLHFNYLTCNISLQDHAEYSPTSTYSVGDTCTVLAEKKNYKCTKDEVLNKNPKDNPSLWVSEPLNAYAMLDMKNSKKTKFQNEISFSFEATNVDNIFLLGLDAKSVEIVVKKGSDVVHNITTTLTEEIKTLWQYFFSERKKISKKAGLNVKSYGKLHISVKIKNPNEIAKCQYLIVGRQRDVGISLQDGASIGIRGIVGNQRDEWGNLTLRKGGAFRSADIPVLIDNNKIDDVLYILEEAIDEPHLWIGDESQNIKSFTLLGKFFDLEVPISSSKSTYNLRLESIAT